MCLLLIASYIQRPLILLPLSFSGYAQISVSLNRMQRYLEQPEVAKRVVLDDGPDEDMAVRIVGADFAWNEGSSSSSNSSSGSTEPTPPTSPTPPRSTKNVNGNVASFRLTDINVEVPIGTLAAVGASHCWRLPPCPLPHPPSLVSLALSESIPILLSLPLSPSLSLALSLALGGDERGRRAHSIAAD